MHWIERHILKVLAFHDSRRYSELKPDGVDGNLFQYHARKLETGGLIARTTDGYSLTESGKSFVADLSQTKLMGRRRLAQAVVMIACRNEAGEYLLFKWRRQPYRGLISLPFGRQTAGIPSSEMASIQLKFKTGYEAELEPLGAADIITYNHPHPIHLVCQIFRGTSLRSMEQPDGLTGEFFWGKPTDFGASAATTGFHQLIEWVEDPQRLPLLELNV